MYQMSGKIYRELPVELIYRNPLQPRKEFRLEELTELAESISSIGIIQPLTVRYRGDAEYEVVAGERRLLAAKMAGLQRVPCLIVDADNRSTALMAMVENLQRKDLNFFEEANGIAFILDLLDLTQEQVANKLGISQSAIANKLRLLKPSQEIQAVILQNGLSERHARAVLKLPDNDSRKKVLEFAIKRKLRVSQLEAYIERVLQEKPVEEKQPSTSKTAVPVGKGGCRDLRVYLNTLNQTVDLMKSSGISTWMERTEDPAHITYKIEIAK